MTHPITELQTSLVAALLADTQLVALLAGNAIFDTPPKGATPPYITIVRHDVLTRDGDLAPGYDHRLLLHCRVSKSSRKAVLEIVERLVFVAITIDLSSAGLIVTHAQHDRTDTSVDLSNGQAHAAVVVRFLSEPVT